MEAYVGNLWLAIYNKDGCMKKNIVNKSDFFQRLKQNRRALVIEILLTCGLTVAVILIGWSNLFHQSQQYASEVKTDYQAIITGYVQTFNAIVVQLEDKIAEDPSFEEMNAWLQSKEEGWGAAIGTDIYDGIAMTYKGGYAHSWNYGEYSDYDPNTRPWYQQAQAADGEVTVVAPYVTYLDPSYFADDEYILMTIAQKYNDEISFDYDIKIKGIEKILTGRTLLYDNSSIMLYDPQGYILSSNNDELFAHNIYQVDDVVSDDLSETMMQGESMLDTLLIDSVDGKAEYIYMSKDQDDNIICMMFPFTEVFVQNFLPIVLIACFMIAFEIYLYGKNKRSLIEFHRRDQRLTALTDASYQQRFYVDVDTQQFHGNDTAARWCPSGRYYDLF